MTSIIKNQIIKHLSVFAKNLTPDQISVEILRGKGELRNIELNERIIAERLEFPAWLQICHARCNRVVVKVPWTKIKSMAVELHVDEIEVMIRLSSNNSTNINQTTNFQTTKAYDLAERVIEGLSIYVQTVMVQFESNYFGGSLMFSRLSVESKSPHFKDEKDLHMTRIHDKNFHQLIFFKQISWQLFKIEASAIKNNDIDSKPNGIKRKNALNSPLRLITTGEGKCNIVIKKNDLNCSVVGGRIEVFLEEILWVATLLQLKSAINFYKHIMHLANSTKKSSTDNNPFLIDLQPKYSFLSANLQKISNMEAFKKYDFPRSSHHLQIFKINLHLFDDSSENLLPSDWGINNGAIQATLDKLCIDFYPSYSVFEFDGRFANRSDWVCYNPYNSCTILTKKMLSYYLHKFSKNMESSLRERFERIWPYLCSKNVIIRIENIAIQCVSEQNTKRDSLQHLFKQKKILSNDLSCSKISFISFFHLEFSSYFFQASNAYPLPSDSTYFILGPFEFLFDYRSVRWMVYVFENILNAFDTITDLSKNNFSFSFQTDFRAEFSESRIILHTLELTNDDRLPKRFLLDFSNIHVSNFKLPDSTLYENFQNDYNFSDITLCLNRLIDNCKKNFDLKQLLFFSDALNKFSSEFLSQKLKELNDCALDSIFCSNNDIKLFISITNVTFSSDFGKNTYETILLSKCSAFFVLDFLSPMNLALLKVHSDVCISLDHFQFIRLLQLHTQLINLINLIETDRNFFSSINLSLNDVECSNTSLSMLFFCNIELINVYLILPLGSVPSPYNVLISSVNEKTSTVSNSTNFDKNVDTLDKQIYKKNYDLLQIKSNSILNKLQDSVSADLLTKTLEKTNVNKFYQSTTSVLNNFDAFSESFNNYNSAANRTKSINELSVSSNLNETIAISNTLNYNDQLCLLIDRKDLNEKICDTEAAIEVVDEAGIIDLLEHWKNVKEKSFSQKINVLNVSIKNTVFFLTALSNLNNQSPFFFVDTDKINETKKQTLKANVVGSSLEIELKEQFNQLRKDIYKSFDKKIEQKNKFKNCDYNPQLKFNVDILSNNKTCIKAYFDGKNNIINLSDEIVSHLTPFTENTEINSEPLNPPELEVNLSNVELQIQNSKKQYPMKIRINSELTISDGPCSFKT